MTANRRRLLLALVAQVCCVACTMAGTHSQETRRSSAMSGSTTVTAADFTRVEAQGSLMNALRQTRPWFLGSRGSTPMVVIDGSGPTELSILESLPARGVLDVTLARASSSPGHAGVTSDGRVIVGDLLLVRTRGR